MLGDGTLTRYVEEGLIPPPHQIGNAAFRSRRFWWEHEVVEFLERAAAETAKLDEATTKRRADKAEQRAKFLAAL